MDDEFLSHDYDAVKRREYYLKTRQLKGRQPKKAVQPAKKIRAIKKPLPPKKTRAQRQAERRKKIQAQVNALKARLEKLKAVLAQLVKQAKSRSGQKTEPKKSSEKKSDGGQKQAPKQTAKQKADAAKRSKEYYEKNKDAALADELKSLTGKIKTIQERIAKMKKSGSTGTRNSTGK